MIVGTFVGTKILKSMVYNKLSRSLSIRDDRGLPTKNINITKYHIEKT